MKLNELEQKILEILVQSFDIHGEGMYSSFAPLMKQTEKGRSEVRKACRSLKRKGLADYARGLWNEDGGPGGAGYGATQQGSDFIENQNQPKIV